MLKRLILILSCSLFVGHALAGAPAGRNTSISADFDRQTPPTRVNIWLQESGGYDQTDPQKWGRNVLTCQSKTDSRYGACMTAPVWYTTNTLLPNPIALRFTQEFSHKTVDINVYGQKNMTISGIAYSLANHVTLGSDTVRDWSKEPNFSFYIPKSELNKLSSPGIWRATLRMNLRQWASGNCGGSPVNNEVGCPGYATIAVWQANIRIGVVDEGSQQVYLPAFPHSAPMINMNLNNYPGMANSGEMRGQVSLDMCLFDGRNAGSSRLVLRFEDEGHAAPGRASGAFSLWRLGGETTSARDRLDYQVQVTNPLTASSETAENGVDIVWQGTNQRRLVRQVILPGSSESVFCVPAPIQLNTRFTTSSKNAGDYTGTLRIVFTPST